MIFDRYLFKSLAIATAFIAVTLAFIIFLTQSLRQLELVIDAGASGGLFLLLTLLALPRFFEIILPIALMAAVLFVYNRMIMDSEMVVMRAVGTSPRTLARPALWVSGVVMVIVLIMTAWLGPVTLSNMQSLRQSIKAQYSNLLFREGVFNSVGSSDHGGLTIFVRDRAKNGDLEGLMIYDSRPQNKSPVTVIAKRGVLVANDRDQQVIVYDGSRQAYDPGTGNLARLDFTRYTIDLPDNNGSVSQHWREPDERTLWELFNPDLTNVDDRNSRRDFIIEAHRRLVSPLLAPGFALIGLVSLLLGPLDRRGMGRRIGFAVMAVALIEGLYITAFNFSKHSMAGLVFMYVLAIGPLIFGLYLLHPVSERMQQRLIRLWLRQKELP
jgi:lipopolysaccharide export system permease protein